MHLGFIQAAWCPPHTVMLHGQRDARRTPRCTARKPFEYLRFLRDEFRSCNVEFASLAVGCYGGADWVHPDMRRVLHQTGRNSSGVCVGASAENPWFPHDVCTDYSRPSIRALGIWQQVSLQSRWLIDGFCPHQRLDSGSLHLEGKKKCLNPAPPKYNLVDQHFVCIWDSMLYTPFQKFNVPSLFLDLVVTRYW
jgi:hypothetical protein